MSAAPQGGSTAAQAVVDDSTEQNPQKEEQKKTELGEDDEFEDFPIEGTTRDFLGVMYYEADCRTSI